MNMIQTNNQHEASILQTQKINNPHITIVNSWEISKEPDCGWCAMKLGKGKAFKTKKQTIIFAENN